MPADTPALLTVRDAAARLGVTPRTLKYYEELGLVSPSRSEGRYRLYDEADLERFGRVLRLRALGFSLQGITEMLKRPLEKTADGRNRYSAASLTEIQQGLREQLQTLDSRIESVRRELREAQQVRGDVVRDLDYVTARLAGVPSDQLLAGRAAPVARRARKPAGNTGVRPATTKPDTPR